MKYFCVVGFIHILSASFAQSLPYNILFDDTKVNAIYITISPDSLTQMYNEVSNIHEYPVQFVYDFGAGKDTLQDVGFRLRGNTSLSSAKKSFKISFNSFEAGREYDDVEKLNLIGNHNDPSMIREKIYFDAYNAFGLYTRRISFVKVYINNDYYGLYSNAEEYDEIFLKSRFGESTGNLFKCLYGGDFSYRGLNQSAYTSSYELHTNEIQNNYSDLIHFIDILNNTPIADLPCKLEKVFDVDNFLKIYALDISAGHWDNYGFNQNNYYIYHNQFTDKFEFLSYDADNTFGVDWIGLNWTTRNIYNWQNDGDRPLVTQLMQVPEYRDKFSYYLNALIHGILLPDSIFPHIDSLHTLITPAALADDYKGYDWGYTDEDFINALTTDNIDDHTPYGVENFIALRNDNSEAQLELNNISPVIKNDTHIPQLPNPTEEVVFNVTSYDDGTINSVILYYNYDSSATLVSVPLFDDGLHNDSLAADHIYGNTLSAPAVAGKIFYTVDAIDNTDNSEQYPSCGFNVIKVGFTPPSLVINEWMAKNISTITDNFNEYEDYIELYNTGTSAIFLGDYFLSDKFSNPSKWKLPDISLNANSYLIIYADDEPTENMYHANFKLNGDGDNIGLFAGVQDYFSVIDTFSFGEQIDDISIGRLPNGIGDIVVLPSPTPGYNNEDYILPVDSLTANQILILGNPRQEASKLILQLAEDAQIDMTIYGVQGQLTKYIASGLYARGNYTFNLTDYKLTKGLWLIRAIINGKPYTLKLIVV